MKTLNEKVEQHIKELQKLVKGSDAGLVLAYTGPGAEGRTQSLSVGDSLCLATNYLALQNALKEDAENHGVCKCQGCTMLRAINDGAIRYDDYAGDKKKAGHTFVVDNPSDFLNVLDRIARGDF